MFSWFGSKSKEQEEMVSNETIDSPEIGDESNVSTENEKKDEDKHLITITWGTGMPIDIIFNFIHKNFEEEGFQDALVNSDIAYREAKEKIIRYDLEMLFKRITLRYKNDIRDIDVEIDNATRAYALAAAKRLQSRCETFKEHLAEIEEMRQLLLANDPKMTTMIESYRRGFLKGITSKAMNFVGDNQN